MVAAPGWYIASRKLSSTSAACAAVPRIKATARAVPARPEARRASPRSRSSDITASSTRTAGVAKPGYRDAYQSTTARWA